jgi:ComF family protein
VAGAGLTVGRAGGVAARLAGDLMQFLLPRVCSACRRLMDEGERGIVCGRCWARLARLPAPQCERCGHPTRALSCRWCEFLPPYVRCARSVCWTHAGTARAILHALKYDGWSAVADGVGERMARLPWPEDVSGECTALVPVPLAAVRERERGYNQSTLLALAMAPRWGVPVWHDVLTRDRATRTQTRLTPTDRSRNVSRAFQAPAGSTDRLPGAHIMLVDDVVTTAATLNACASALFGAGARIISYVTFGRAPTAADRT